MKRGILLMICAAIASGSLAYTTSVGLDLTHEEVVTMAGSSASFGWSGTAGQSLGIGSAATVITIPDAGGAGPVNVGAASITLEFGSQWILDGTNYPGPYTVGTRFVLARGGAFSGSVRGVRFRNFSLPSNRDLQLFVNSTSLYYEVVS
ncbi:MAG: hypothetical protein MUC65_06590, partial [Pontiellaceae bacterium]|nr:hypothetical protein [Pontiellaceae bacterium]